MQFKFDAFSFVTKSGDARHKLEVLLALGMRDENFEQAVIYGIRVQG